MSVVLLIPALHGMTELKTNAESLPVQIRHRGYTPLHLAVYFGDREQITRLIADGAVVDAKSVSGYTPLHIAAERGDVTTVELFITELKKTNQTIAPSSRVDIRDNSHVTPLACAATNGHIDVLGCLIGHGANIRQADKRGYFPFHRAAQNGHLEAMKMLLPNKYMCSEEEYLYFWSRAMTCSVESGKVEALAFVMNMRPEKGIREVSPLLLAASYGHVSLMEWYLGQAGTSISERDHEGASALHYAARYGQVNAVQFLLDRDP